MQLINLLFIYYLSKIGLCSCAGFLEHRGSDVFISCPRAALNSPSPMPILSSGKSCLSDRPPLSSHPPGSFVPDLNLQYCFHLFPPSANTSDCQAIWEIPRVPHGLRLSFKPRQRETKELTYKAIYYNLETRKV